MNFEWVLGIAHWTPAEEGEDEPRSDRHVLPITDFVSRSGAAQDADWRLAFDVWGQSQAPFQYRQFPHPPVQFDAAVAPEAVPSLMIERRRR